MNTFTEGFIKRAMRHGLNYVQAVKLAELTEQQLQAAREQGKQENLEKCKAMGISIPPAVGQTTPPPPPKPVQPCTSIKG